MPHHKNHLKYLSKRIIPSSLRLEITVSRCEIEQRNLYSKTAPAHRFDQANMGNIFTCFNQMLSRFVLSSQGAWKCFFLLLLFVCLFWGGCFFFPHQQQQQHTTKCCLFLIFWFLCKINMETSQAICHSNSNVTYLETSELKSHPWIKSRMKTYCQTTENLNKHSFLIHSLVSSFIHRDQMNSGKNKETQTIRKQLTQKFSL